MSLKRRDSQGRGAHLIHFDLEGGGAVNRSDTDMQARKQMVDAPKSKILTGLGFLRESRCLLISSSIASDLFFASSSARILFSLSNWDSSGGGAKTRARGSSVEDLETASILKNDRSIWGKLVEEKEGVGGLGESLPNKHSVIVMWDKSALSRVLLPLHLTDGIPGTQSVLGRTLTIKLYHPHDSTEGSIGQRRPEQ